MYKALNKNLFTSEEIKKLKEEKILTEQ